MHALTVSKLSLEIKKNLEGNFPCIYVQGEVSNSKLQSSGHLYFTLKDEASQISCVLFKGQARSISQGGTCRHLKDGDKIVLQGEISVYMPRGTYQIIVKSLDFLGTGDLLLQLHQLKVKLEAEGLFDKSRKKALPKTPKTIGVITSPTGAVIQDILHVLKRRSRGFHLILNPVKVQGDGASSEIARAINEMNQHKMCDVLIVGRGGGSLEDLWAFNEEQVVRAVASSKIPIISAVGHETDVCLCDFAADVRAPTPSAAAEICTQEKNQQIDALQKISAQMKHHVFLQLQSSSKQLLALKKHPSLTSPKSILFTRMQDIDERKEELHSAMCSFFQKKTLEIMSKQKQSYALKPSNQIKNTKDKISYFQKAITASMLSILQQQKAFLAKNAPLQHMKTKILTDIVHKKKSLAALGQHLQGVSPKNLLSKGYCILFSEKNDSVILSTHDVSLEDRLRVLMGDGQITVKVEAK